jgi:hypothetical protein
VRVQKAGARLDVYAELTVAGMVSAPAYATEQSQQRQDAWDTRQTARPDARQEKVDCRANDKKSRPECRQDKRDAKQDARGTARDIKYGD